MVRAKPPISNLHLVALNLLRKTDFLAFSLIIFLAMRSRIPGLRVPNILDIIAKDATRYFLVIFTSHLVFELTLSFGRVSAIVTKL